ncbi:MAG: hypothetical protein U0837_18265 [Dehalococcoidia bacterium]
MVSNQPGPGLCALCRHARQVVSGRGSVFLMCELAKSDPRFRKYPALPVLRCAGFKENDPDAPG